MEQTSGDVEHEIGKRERLVAGRRQELVELSPAHLSVNQPAAQKRGPAKLNLDYNGDGTVGDGNPNTNVVNGSGACGSNKGDICGGWS